MRRTPAVIPAKAGIHFDLRIAKHMDSGFRRNDGACGVPRELPGVTALKHPRNAILIEKT